MFTFMLTDQFNLHKKARKNDNERICLNITAIIHFMCFPWQFYLLQEYKKQVKSTNCINVSNDCLSIIC